MLFPLELAAARAVGALSRLSGRGGGTTLPGKLLVTVDPGAVARLAAALPGGCALVSATNGKTTTTAMAAELVGGRLAYNRSGANLLSGVASALLAASDAELGLFECDEAALPVVARRLHPRLIALGNLFRDQLDRYGELELVAAGWRSLLADQPEAVLVVNVDDPQLAELDPVAARPRLRYGLDDPAHGRSVLPHAADARRCAACAAPLAYDAIYVGHLGAWSCTSCGRARPPLDLAAREIELRGLAGSSFTLAYGDESWRCELALPGLYNVYNATAAAAVALTLGTHGSAIAERLRRVVPAFGRFERIPVGERTLLLLLIKNPAGANEAIATLLDGSPPTLALVALNDELADGRDVSWIWDVDFEPLLGGLERVVVSGSRAEELALRFAYGGLARERIDVVPALEQALDRGLELTPTGAELVVLPTYTAMLVLRRLLGRRAHLPAYWEARA